MCQVDNPRKSFNPGYPTPCYVPNFKIGLRADDREILVEIVERTRIGHLLDDPRPKGMNPVAVWIVGSKAECLALVRFLDRYPLRAKKRRDYEVWREAIIAWQSVRQWGTQGADWTRIAELRVALMATRGFSGSVSEIERPPAPPTLFEEAS